MKIQKEEKFSSWFFLPFLCVQLQNDHLHLKKFNLSKLKRHLEKKDGIAHETSAATTWHNMNCVNN